MTYEPLHHKYRPQTFAELVGQEAIATTLTTAIERQQIAPAYLFTGARGTGKTSSARILAKSLNCLSQDVPTAKPCGVCEVCRSIAQGNSVDVIEIDAASNTGVDNIRELIERSRFAPMQCRYKVYVIDECHMLSAAAFNALLKTLEEPPPHVVFILATTDPQRVLPTIISRCQRFDYRRIDLTSMVAHLQMIAAKESIAITPEALQLVAQISQGGLRDAESLLDQLSLIEGEVTAEAVWEFVGAVPEQDLLELVSAIARNDAITVLDQVRKLMDRGREPLIVLQNLASFYRDLLIAKTSPHRQDLVAMTTPTWTAMCDLVQSWEVATLLQGQQRLRESEVQVKNTTQPRLWLEVTLLGLLPEALHNISAITSTSRPSQIARSTPQSIPSSILSSIPSSVPSSVPSNIPSSASSADSRTAANRSSVATPTEPPSIDRPASLPTSAISLPEAAASIETPTNFDSVAATPDPLLESAPLLESEFDAIDPLPSIADAATEPQVDLPQVWQNLLANIRFRGTQTLLQQHGSLLFFDGQKARIGIRSHQLLKIMQPKLPDIEAALEQLYGCKIKVTLEVPAPASVSTSAPPAPTNTPPASPSQSANHRSPRPAPPPSAIVPPAIPSIAPPPSQLPSAYPPPTQVAPPPTAREAPPSIANDPQPPESSGPRSQSSSPPPLPPMPAIDPATDHPPSESIESTPIETQPTWYFDEVQAAAKSLAQFFNGQIVTLIEDPVAETEASAEELSSDRPETETDSDPDKDVPF